MAAEERERLKRLRAQIIALQSELERKQQLTQSQEKELRRLNEEQKKLRALQGALLVGHTLRRLIQVNDRPV